MLGTSENGAVGVLLRNGTQQVQGVQSLMEGGVQWLLGLRTRHILAGAKHGLRGHG